MNDPTILCVDTSTDQITVAICRGKEILVDISSPAEKHHSRRLLKLIDECFHKANITLNDVDAFATTTGPGSFTGLRTSLGTLKGLVFSMNKPLIGIPTLVAMIYPCEMEVVVPVIHARRGFVYTGLFEKIDGKWREIEGANMKSIEELSKFIPTMATVIGMDSHKYLTEYPELFPASLKVGNSKFDYICGTTLCEISHQKFIDKEFEDIFSIEPIYIQKTAAEGYV
jgi:tRNA threonylcarbamoyladenosine biosynthesis protein TsaB